MKRQTIVPAVSAVTSFNTAPIPLGDIVNGSVSAHFTGSDVVGTFKLQWSNDGTNFADVASGSVSITASGDDGVGFSNIGWAFIRGVWTYSSGTGNIEVTYIGKEALPRPGLK